MATLMQTVAPDLRTARRLVVEARRELERQSALLKGEQVAAIIIEGPWGPLWATS